VLALWLNWQGDWAQRLLWIAVAAAMVVALVEEVRGYHKDAIVMTRNFYGSLRVVESVRGGGNTRTLYHGTVQHGAQYLDPAGAASRPPTSARFRRGLVLRFCCAGPKRVGIIGSRGHSGAYGKPGDSFHFYEINPQVIDLAKSHFTFLGDSKATIDIAPGDARLSLERETVPSMTSSSPTPFRATPSRCIF